MRHPKLAFALLLVFLGSTLWLSLVYEDWGFRSNARPLRLAVDVWVGFAPLYLAQEKGLFAKHNVEVDLRTMKGAEEIRAAMVAGEIDGQTTSLDTIVMQNDQGVPSVCVLALDRSAGGDGIVANSDARTVAELRGRTVAFQPATPSHFFLLFHLDRAGLLARDVKGLSMDSGDAGAAFVARRVDAAVTWEPWLTKASLRSGAHVLASTRGAEITIVDMLAFRPDILRDRPDEVRGVVRAWNDAVAEWRRDPASSNRLMAAHYRMDEQAFAQSVGGLEYLDLEANRRFLGTAAQPGAVLELVDRINQVFLKNGVTKSSHGLASVLAYDFQL